MARLHVVTDSGIRLTNPRLLQQAAVTVVPNRIEIGGKVYREDVDLSAEDLLHLIGAQKQSVRILAPSVEEYASVYANLSRTYDGILSIHSSREILHTWHHAREAAHQMGGGCEIAVIDGRTICAGLAMLLRVAIQSISEQVDFETAVKRVRSAIDRIYSVYYVETLDFLHQNKLLSESHALLGSLLGIKPFLSIEDGHLLVIEKARSRTQAIERLVEFLIEFEELDDAAILQPRANMSDQTRALQDRLAVEFPGRHFPYLIYSATMATLIGPDATGIVVLESEMEQNQDGF